MRMAIICFITTLISGCASTNGEMYKVCHVSYVNSCGVEKCLDYSYIYNPVKRAKYPDDSMDYGSISNH